MGSNREELERLATKILRETIASMYRNAEELDEAITAGGFSAWLKTLLKQRGLTQAQLGKAVGVSTGTIGNWVLGRTQPAASELMQIMVILAGDSPGEIPELWGEAGRALLHSPE